MPRTTMRRFVKIGPYLYKIAEQNRKKALEDAIHMGLAVVELNPKDYGMTVVSEDPVEDWTFLSSHKAKDLLEGKGIDAPGKAPSTTSSKGSERTERGETRQGNRSNSGTNA